MIYIKKVIVYVSYMVMLNKIKKYKKIYLPLINIYCCQTYIF